MPETQYAPPSNAPNAKPKSALPQIAGMALLQNGIGLALAFFLEKGEISCPEARDLKGSVTAFCVYIMVVYILMFRQGMTKSFNAAIIDHPDHSKRIDVVLFMSNVNRSFENALEQMPIFLLSFFFYTTLVNPARGGGLGLIYAFFTALYPCLHGSPAIMATTFPRYFMNHFMIWAVIVSALRTGVQMPTSQPSPAPTPRPMPSPTSPPTHPPTPVGYSQGSGHVYSNNKYLADFESDMTLDLCKHRCNHWQEVCDEVCSKKNTCLLSDNVDVRHFTRHASCQKECMGFNWHPDTGHCTLFSDNMELLHGGRGIYYGRPGYPNPKWGTLMLYLKDHGITAQNLLTPMSVVVAGAVASLAFFAIRWVRGPSSVETTRDLRLDAEEPFVITEE